MSYHIDVTVRHANGMLVIQGTVMSEPSNGDPHVPSIQSQTAGRFEHSIKEGHSQRLYTENGVVVIPAAILAQSSTTVAVRLID